MEELGLPYQVHPYDIIAGDQHQPKYAQTCPSRKVPAIVDPDGPGGRRGIAVDLDKIRPVVFGKEPVTAAVRRHLFASYPVGDGPTIHVR